MQAESYGYDSKHLLKMRAKHLHFILHDRILDIWCLVCSLAALIQSKKDLLPALMPQSTQTIK